MTLLTELLELSCRVPFQDMQSLGCELNIGSCSSSSVDGVSVAYITLIPVKNPRAGDRRANGLQEQLVWTIDDGFLMYWNAVCSLAYSVFRDSARARKLSPSCIVTY